MSTIRESNLPGVGKKFQIETTSGDRLVIVIHDDGRREIYHFDRKSFDRADSVVTLTDGEARQVAGIVGGLSYVPKALAPTELILDDLVLEWFRVSPESASVGKTLRELQARTVTGASVVSIIEPSRINRINPEADTTIVADSTLILAGDRKNLALLKRLLNEGRT